jgi:hypothetical protein
VRHLAKWSTSAPSPAAHVIGRRVGHGPGAGRNGSPEQRPPEVTKAVGPLEGVEAARPPRASRAGRLLFAARNMIPSRDRAGTRLPPASMVHTSESYGYIRAL